MHKNFINSFYIKIFALLAMTLDHIAIIFVDKISPELFTSLRIVGRLSFPLFAFSVMISMLHTKSKKNYFIRLGSEATLIAIALYMVEEIGGYYLYGNNIFVTLLLGAAIIGCLQLKGNAKFGSLAFIALTFILEFRVELKLDFIPTHITPMYGIFGVTLITMFYLAHLGALQFIKSNTKKYELDTDTFEKSDYGMTLKNMFYIGALILTTLLFYFVYKSNDLLIDNINISTQAYCILSGAFLLFYNGKRGYNSKWFKYGCYIYYPLHIVLIYGLSLLV